MRPGLSRRPQGSNSQDQTLSPPLSCGSGIQMESLFPLKKGVWWTNFPLLCLLKQSRKDKASAVARFSLYTSLPCYMLRQDGFHDVWRSMQMQHPLVLWSVWLQWAAQGELGGSRQSGLKPVLWTALLNLSYPFSQLLPCPFTSLQSGSQNSLNQTDLGCFCQ